MHSLVDLVADHLGTIVIESFTPANADATPERTVDTRDSATRRVPQLPRK